MSRSLSDSSPSESLNQRKAALLQELKDLRRFPEGSHVVPSKQASPPVPPENVSPSPMGKGMEETRRTTSAELPQFQAQAQFPNELTEGNPKQHTSSPKGKITSNFGKKRGSRLSIHSTPVLPFEDGNTSVNSNESFLDYNIAKDESESLLKDQPKENSIKMSFWPWGKLLNMYSKIKKSPIPKLYFKENAQESLKEDGQCIQLIVYRCNEKNPMIFSHFRTTDSVVITDEMLNFEKKVSLKWK
ncbi:uncharacterized protein [Narcine bancroftii]|uniref:uncharacterized protein isoform X2 n=1 Tax=Narcine bancroftii TaxID=1343680 RepID=UPI003831CFB4